MTISHMHLHSCTQIIVYDNAKLFSLAATFNTNNCQRSLKS